MKMFVAVAFMAVALCGATDMPLDSSDASAMRADEVPSEQFRDFWRRAGRMVGYPTTGPSADPGKITLTLADPKWFGAQFDAWNGYDNRIKLYLAGLFVNLKHEHPGKPLTAADFKSLTMGYYQCMNTVARMLGRFKAAGGPAEGTVEETLALCGMGRIF